MGNNLKVMLFVTILLLGVGMVSAAEFDNSKSVRTIEKGQSYTLDKTVIAYNPLWEKYKPIQIKNLFGLGSTLLEAVLTEHTETCGQSCSSVMQIYLANKDILIQDIRFYTIDGDKRTLQNIRSFQIYIKTDESEYEVNDYEYICTPTGKVNLNGTAEQTCENKLIGSHIVKTPLWEVYTIGTEVPAGTYEIKLEGEKRPDRTVDWQIKTNGVWTTDWAVWGGGNGGLNVIGATGGNTGANNGDYGMWVSVSYTLNLTYMIMAETSARTKCSVIINSTNTNVANGTVSGSNCYLNYTLQPGILYKFISVATGSQTIGEVVGAYGYPLTANGSTILGGLDTPSYSGQILTDRMTGIKGLNTIQTASGITLNSPANNYISPTNSVNFSCSANVTGGAILTNMSLWTNSTGTWALNQTTAVGFTEYFNNGILNTNYFNFFRSTSCDAGQVWTETIVANASCQSATDNWKLGVQLKKNYDWNVTPFNITIDHSQSQDASSYFRIGYANLTNNVGATSTLSWQSDYYEVINPNVVNQTNLRIAWIPNSTGINIYLNETFVKTIRFNATAVPTIAQQTGSGLFAYFTLHNATITSGSNPALFNLTITQPTLWTCQACDSDGDCGFANENRTVSVDIVGPSITINLPTGTSNIGYLGGNETLNWTITDVNLASMWYNYNGTNITVLGANNQTQFNLSHIPPQNLTFYANDTVGNLASAFTSWVYTVFVNSQNYNTTTYETSSETLSVNATGATSTNLVYDSTSYAATQSGDIWSKTISIPTITSPINKTFYWNFQSGINTTSLNQSVLQANFSICGGVGGATKFLNFTFKDESTSAVLNASNDLTSATYWLGDGSVTKAYTFQNSTVNYNYVFCALPNRTFIVDMSFKYSNPSYPLRTFTYDNQALTNSTTYKTLYMLGSTDGIYTAIRTAESSGAAISGVVITYEREIAGVWTLIGQEVTGDDGIATIWVNPNYQYRFTATKSGYTTVQVIIQPSQSQYTITMTAGAGGAYTSPVSGIKWFVYPSSGTMKPKTNQDFNATVTSSFGDLVNCKFELLNATNYTQVLATTTGITNSTYCYLQILYTTRANQNLFGRVSIQTTNSTGFFILDSGYKWILIDKDIKGWSTITSFFTDLKGLNEFGNTTNEAEFSQIILFFLIITILIGVFTYFSGVELSTPGVSLIILLVIIWIASVSGFLSFNSGSSHLSTWVEQYGFATMFTLQLFGYVLSLFRRTGE